eukprot:scaffold17388_cov46-Attheya_sp.AAC.3
MERNMGDVTAGRGWRESWSWSAAALGSEKFIIFARLTGTVHCWKIPTVFRRDKDYRYWEKRRRWDCRNHSRLLRWLGRIRNFLSRLAWHPLRFPSTFSP